MGNALQMRSPEKPDSTPALSLYLDVKRTPQAVSSVRGAIRGLLRGASVPADAVDAMEIVTAEACGNVVRHGSGERYSVSVDLSDNRCELEVIAEGELTRPGPAKDDDVLAESGRGCAVMEALTDEFALDASGDGSILHVAKRWSLTES